MKTKPKFIIERGPELSVEGLKARVRESAERRGRASPEGADGLSLENVLRSQADLNGAVAGSLRLVALHLQYAQEKFDAVEQSLGHEGGERERADRLLSEGLEQMSAAVEGVRRKVETVVENFAALERRVTSELAELRRSLAALTDAAAAPRE